LRLEAATASIVRRSADFLVQQPIARGPVLR
jgi:hypothetical protein